LRTGTWILLSILLGIGTTAKAEPDAGDVGDLAKQTQNPVADLISVPFQNNTDFGWGADDDARNTLNIQPVWPVRVTESWNVITRTIVPVVSQPARVPGENRQSGLGDTTFTAFLSPSEPGAVVWGVGPAVLLPTATAGRLGADKWGLGPSVVLLAMPGNWVVGSLFSNLWSVGGSGDESINLFTWQYFVNYNLPRGWYLVTAPIMNANWKANSGNRWTIPIGGGVGRVLKLGKLPINAQAQAFYNVERPRGAADWQLRMQIQLLFPK